MRLKHRKNTTGARRRLIDNKRNDESTDFDRKFKRNATISGYRVSPTRNEDNGGSDQSHRKKTHHLANKRRNISGLLLISVVIASLVGYILWQFTASVTISVSNARVSSDKVLSYTSTVQSYYKKRPFERLRFAINQDVLLTHLQESHPEIAKIDSIEFKDFAHTRIVLRSRVPIAVWDISDQSQYVGIKGVSFTVNHHESPPVRVVDNSGVRVAEGAEIASGRFLGFIGQVIGESSRQNLSVKEVILPYQTTRQLEVKVEKYSYPIKFSLDRPVVHQVEDMKRTIEYFSSIGKSPEYVDVRVAGRAYYR